MKRLLLISLLLLAACGTEETPAPIELASLLEEESPAPSPSELPLCEPPILEVSLDDWQAFLDQPLGEERDPDRPTPRRLLRKWMPLSIIAPGPTAARLQVEALSVGVDSAGTPGLRALEAVATLEMEEGPSRDALGKDLERWIRALHTVIPGAPEVTVEGTKGALAVRVRIGAQDVKARPSCRPEPDSSPATSGVRLRVGVQALLDVVEQTAGPLLLWSVLPEELEHWRTLELAVRSGGADRVTLRLDTGAGALAQILAQARAPARPGWDRFLPPATPMTAGFYLNDAEAWTHRLSDLMFEKGFKLDGFDPVKLLDKTWEHQLGELLSGPAVGFPIVENYNLKTWDEGWIVYLQPKDVAELDARLKRVFNLKRYVTRPETFRKRDLTVVRFKTAGKGKVGGVRFAWYCEDAGCWLTRNMSGFDQLFDVKEGAATPQAQRVRSLLTGDALAFMVVSPRTFGERFQLPEPKKKKKKKKGALPLPSFGDRDAIARTLVENAIRGALTDLPEDLLVAAALRSDGVLLELEVTGLFRLLGRVATQFLPLL
ncbi:MAG: hypothetical protein ABIK09_04410 [Pseudomonadota bacterium]